MREIVFHPIGTIHTPHRDQVGAPIQPVYATESRGTVILLDQYVEALADLAGFERIWLLYHLDRAAAWQSRVVPYRDRVERGLFSTRAPSRPNAIGMSVVTLVSVEGNTLDVRGVDMLDGTPLLDIKPYVSEFDAYPVSRAGWLEASPSERRVADDRFDGRTAEENRPIP